MVSGTDYDSSKFNLAVQSRRQPGSTFKMFVLAAAVETGIDPFNTYYPSQYLELKIPGQTEPWKVEVYGGESYGGTMNIATATLRSDNTVYAQLCLDVSPERVVDIAKRMGITSSLNADPAIAIGGLTYGVSPLEMASAYGTLANQGKLVQPTSDPAREELEGQGHLGGQAQGDPGHLSRRGQHGHSDPRAEHPLGDGHGRQARRPAHGRQDRHRARLARRLVLRLRASTLRRRLDGPP